VSAVGYLQVAGANLSFIRCFAVPELTLTVCVHPRYTVFNEV